jgi:peroxiredoxin
MYCPYCQREAPVINDLFDLIERDSKSKGTIKLIGIGAGNSSFEVDVFKKKYGVPFPLFADEDFSIHKSIGSVRTPYFIVLEIIDGKGIKLRYSQLGGIEGPEHFLKLLKNLTGSDRE